MAKRTAMTSMVLAGGLAAAAMRYGSTGAAPVPPTAQEMGRARAGKGGVAEPDPAVEGRKQGQEELRAEMCRFMGDPVAGCAGEEQSLYPSDAEAAIAIFPDPIHTHLALRFDRSMDALVAAAQDAGWYLDRQWVPWGWMQPGEPAEDKDLKDLASVRTFRHAFETVPGVLFFRPTEGKQTHRLVVFVVGDSPISGILAEQFRTAFDYVQKVQGPGGKELKIIGPSFTGSIESLQALLKGKNGAGGGTAPFSSVVIRSPTISKDLQCNELNHATRTPGGDEGSCTVDGRRWSFASYGTALTAKIDAAVAFFDKQTWHSRGAGATRTMALLSEAETQFGGLAVAGKKGKAVREVDGYTLLNLTFPRDISHLRSAYQKKSVWGFGSSGGSGRVNLDLDFSDPHEEQDTAPSFAGEQTAGSLESNVRQIAQSLKERDVHVVMLSATDVFDELFLARMLNLLAPQLTVVVLDADTLFLHQGSGDNYNHTFAVTPFPLMPANSVWTSPQVLGKTRNCVHREFTSESEQGAYLAAGAVLGGETFVRDNPCASGYTSPLWQTTRPPLWVLAIEGGAYWPYAAIGFDSMKASSAMPPETPANLPTATGLNAGKQGASSDAKQQESTNGGIKGIRREQVPALLWVTMFGLVVLAGIHAHGCLRADLHSNLLWDYAIADEETRAYKLRLQLALTLLGILAARLLMPFRMTEIVSYAAPFLVLGWILMVGLGGLAGAQVFLLAVGGSFRTQTWERKRVLLLAGLVAAGAVLLPLLSGLSHMAMRSKAYEVAGVDVFVRYRSLFLLSGSSPTTALLLLLAAIAFALASRMSRTYFAGPWRPRLPKEIAATMRLPTRTSAEKIEAFASSQISLERAWIWGVVVASVGLVAVAFYQDAPESLDGRRYTLVLQVLGGVVISLLAYDLLRAAKLWGLVRQILLRPLERTPLRRGFDRIKGMAWTHLWKTLANSPQISYRAARRAIELAASNGTRLGSPQKRDDLIQHWNGLVTPGLKDSERAAKWGETMDALASLTEEVVVKLECGWQAEAGCVTGKDDVAMERVKSLDTEDKVLCAQEEFVALVYVQYIHILLIQIRNSLVTAVACYVLLVAALTGYPIVNRHAVETGLLVLFCLLAITVVTVYASINKDSILSRTTESEPGKLDSDFFYKLLGYLGLPLLGLLVSQFPELSGSLLSWVQPGLSSVK